MPNDAAPAGVWRNGESRYGAMPIAMHWIMLLLLVAVYACIELRELFPKGSGPREMLKSWHYGLGLSVFLLVWLRMILLAVAGGRPRILPEPSRWQTFAAGSMHLALYALMVVMPVAGWLILNAEAKPVMFLGLVLPTLTAEDRQFAGAVEEFHETFGIVGYWLIGLHAAAALFHHYRVRDNTLRRMLPSGR